MGRGWDVVGRERGFKDDDGRLATASEKEAKLFSHSLLHLLLAGTVHFNKEAPGRPPWVGSWGELEKTGERA